MRKITNYFIILFLATFSALAQTTTEPPDFPNTGSGTLITLLTGANTVSGTIQTPSDGQDRFQVIVPAGSQLDAITFNYNTSGGSTGSMTFNSSVFVTNSGSVSGTPYTAGTYTIIINSDFAIGNAWNMSFTVSGIANAAPVITGTVPGQTVNDNSTIAPFSAITTTDADGDNISATISLDANAKGILSGTALTGSGPYTILSRTPSALQTALRALIFNPTDNRSTSTETTTFTLVINDGKSTTINSVTTVISSAVAPTITSVAVPANGTYISGQNLDFTVNLSESVTVVTTGGTPQIAITIGATARQATYLSGSGTSALLFRYNIQAGETDADGIGVGSLTASGGTIRDSGGVNATLTLNSVGSTTSVFIDAVAPTITSVTVPANGTYISGQNLDFTVNLSESVAVTTTGGTPQIAITIGASTRQATYQSGSGTSALLFRYTIQAGETDTDGIAVGTLAANGGTIRDAVSNDANFTLNSVGSTTGVFVDALAPVITSVSVPASGSYAEGQNIDFNITFSEAVNVFTTGGIPHVGIDIGGVTRQASYIMGSGNTVVAFRYTVQAGDLDNDGIAVGTLVANGSAIADAAGNNANLTLNNVGSTSSVLIDTYDSFVTSVAVPANGTYIVGQELDFTVNFNENVSISGTPQLAITVGSITRQATYKSGSGSEALVFGYTVQASELDTDGIDIGTLAENGGTIQDAASNDANLTLNNIEPTTNVLVDSRIELSITGLTGDNKIYDGTTDALVSGTPGLSGVVSGDEVTISGAPVFTFASAEVGAAIDIITTGYALSGADAANYTLVQPTFSAEISSAELQITATPGQSKVFGLADPVFVYTVSGFVAGENDGILTGLLTRTAGEDVGNYSLQLGTVSAGSNYTINYTSADFEIIPANQPGLVFDDNSFTYDATVKSLLVSGQAFDATVTYTNNDKINAGIYAVTATITRPNYATEVLNATLTINKAATTITANPEQIFTYDGTVKNVTASLNHSETALTYDPQQGYINAGSYPITVSAVETDNYLAAFQNVNLVIEPTTQEGLVFNDESFTYNATVKSLVVSGQSSDATVTYTNNDKINAGIYIVTATINRPNYTTEVLNATLTINKAAATITANPEQTFTYDGMVKNVAASLNHSETSLTYSPQQGYINAGLYTVSVASEETDNYLSASEDVSLVINNAEITGVIFESDTFTYDNSEHSIFVSGLPEGASVEYNNNSQINVGTYTVTATVSQDNFNDKVFTADLVIQKAEADITTEAVQTFTFDGTVHNVAASLNHSETTLTYGPQQGYINAGTYSVTVASAETDNYLASSKDVSLVIDNAEITGVIFEGDTFVYDGGEHSIFVSGLPEGASVEYNNNGQINAGTYVVTATVSHENFNDKVLTADLVIQKAEAVITAEAVQNFTYDGTAHNVTASLNHSETSVTYSPQQGYVNAGTYPVTVASAETDNYLASSKDVSLVIDNAEITGVTFEGDTFTYNGSQHSTFVSGLPEGASVEYNNNGQINAGTYTVTATVSQDNFNDKVFTAALIINKAEAIITAEAVQTFTYNGTVHNVTASLNHSETTVTFSPQQGYVDEGTYAITVASAETDNYLASSQDVSLVIDKAEITGVTFGSIDTFVYNGTPYSIFVGGLPAGATVSYENNGQLNAGNYTVRATISLENYEDKVLTAVMTINKATQEITFSVIPVKSLETDSDFQLNATASSGLPVGYTYSYLSPTPAAEVSLTGFVKLLHAGEITITATQAGNANYQAAIGTRILNVNSSVAEVRSIAFNGEIIDDPSTEIYYLMECGSLEDEVAILIGVNPNATVDIGTSFTIPVPAPGIYTKSINITSPDGSTISTYNIKVEKRFNFEDIVVQKFNNVLLVNNNPQTNGEYKFASYEWYKNGQLVSRDQYISEGNNASDKFNPNDIFFVKLTTIGGEVLQTCQSAVQLRGTNRVTLAPNPVGIGEQLQLYTDFPSEELNTMEISIHNLSGVLLKKMTSNQKITNIDLPAFIQSGVYVLTIQTARNTKSIKFIVK